MKAVPPRPGGRTRQQAGAHHRRQRQRNHGRDRDGYRQRHREFAEQAPGDAPHQQQWNEHGDQRDGQRHDREADLARPRQGGLHRAHAHLAMAHDVLDHHDGVVDDEAGRHDQRHQRQIVETVAQRRHSAEGGDDRDRQHDAGNQGRAGRPQEEEYDQHHQADGDQQRMLHVGDRGADAFRPVAEHRQLDAARQARLEPRQHGAHAVDRLDDVGAGLAPHVHDDRGLGVRPGADIGVLDAVHHRTDIAQPHRRAVAIGDYQRQVVGRGRQPIVDGEREGLAGAVEASGRLPQVGLVDRGADILEPEAHRRELGGVDLYADGALLTAVHSDQPDAGHFAEALDNTLLDDLVEAAERHRLRRDRQDQDRRVAGVHLAEHGRRRHAARQHAGGSSDRRLHVLAGGVDVAAQDELEHDRRHAEAAGRRHRGHAGDTPELMLERDGDGGLHRLRRGAGVGRDDLDGRKVDVRQRRGRQRPVAEHAEQDDRDGEQPSRDRPMDEDSRDVHEVSPGRARPSPRRGTGTTVMPGRRRKAPSSTMVSPPLRPSATIVMPSF